MLYHAMPYNIPRHTTPYHTTHCHASQITCHTTYHTMLFRYIVIPFWVHVGPFLVLEGLINLRESYCGAFKWELCFHVWTHRVPGFTERIDQAQLEGETTNKVRAVTICTTVMSTDMMINLVTWLFKMVVAQVTTEGPCHIISAWRPVRTQAIFKTVSAHGSR